MTEHAVVLLIVLAGVCVVLLGAIIFLAGWSRQKRAKRLRARFGAEYDRMVAEYGERRARKLLAEREKRVLQIAFRPLSVESREHFMQAWRDVQTQFVDTPGKAVTEADKLLEQLMSQRGYPVGDFEQQAGDLSVHHPRVVESYRAAHAITDSARHGNATTEDLREAIIKYRVLYEELLEYPVSYSSEVNQ